MRHRAAASRLVTAHRDRSCDDLQPGVAGRCAPLSPRALLIALTCCHPERPERSEGSRGISFAVIDRGNVRELAE